MTSPVISGGVGIAGIPKRSEPMSSRYALRHRR